MIKFYMIFGLYALKLMYRFFCSFFGRAFFQKFIHMATCNCISSISVTKYYSIIWMCHSVIFSILPLIYSWRESCAITNNAHYQHEHFCKCILICMCIMSLGYIPTVINFWPTEYVHCSLSNTVEFVSKVV